MKSCSQVTLPVETQRLRLRSICFRDMEDYFEIFSDPAIARFDDYEVLDRSDLAEIFEAYRLEAEAAEETAARAGGLEPALFVTVTSAPQTHFEYAVEFKETGKMVGILTILVRARRQWIGYHFNREWHGRGLASECVEAFKAATAKRIWAKVDIRNAPSIRVLQKCGFTWVKDTVDKAGLSEHVYVFEPRGVKPRRKDPKDSRHGA